MVLALGSHSCGLLPAFCRHGNLFRRMQVESYLFWDARWDIPGEFRQERSRTSGFTGPDGQLCPCILHCSLLYPGETVLSGWVHF